VSATEKLVYADLTAV